MQGTWPRCGAHLHLPRCVRPATTTQQLFMLLCSGRSTTTRQSLAHVLLCAASAGSSTQIGVLVVPFCVVLSWMMGRPLDLNFKEFEALVLFISVLLAAVVVQVGGTSSVWGVATQVDAACMPPCLQGDWNMRKDAPCLTAALACPCMLLQPTPGW